MEADLSFTLLESSNFFNNYLSTVTTDHQSSSQNINNESFPTAQEKLVQSLSFSQIDKTFENFSEQTNRSENNFESNSTSAMNDTIHNSPSKLPIKNPKLNQKKSKKSNSTVSDRVKLKFSHIETEKIPSKRLMSLEKLSNTNGSNEKKRVHRYCPDDTHFNLECEWNDCDFISSDISSYFSHIDQHIQVKKIEQINNNNEQNLECKWKNCDCTEINEQSTFERHVLFHAFHTKLKKIGQKVLDSYNKSKIKTSSTDDAQSSKESSFLSNVLVKCNLDEQTRNSIPELPFEFACSWNYCDYDTNNPEAFYKHIRECHIDKMRAAEIKTSNMKCMWSECEQRIANKDRLVEHMRHHSQEKLAACPNCGALFASFTKFIDHCSRSITVKIQIDLGFQCSHCNKKFATNNLLKEHVRKHINRKKCPLCDMTCIDKNDLSKHILYRHTNLKAHTCPHCDYSSKTANDLQKHINSIHGERDDYQCNLCEYKTKNLNTIRRHMIKNHLSKEDSLKYNDGQQFSSSYLCHVCNKVYSSSATLSNHLKDAHHFQLPAGHSRFQYKLDVDGFYRLQTLRYESVELSEEIKKTKACLEIDALSDNPLI